MSELFYRRYEDTIHKIQALAIDKLTAWQLIRNECTKGNIEIPTLEQIIRIKDNE